jgi:hypothetical protein
MSKQGEIMNTRSVILKFAAVTSLAAAVLSSAWAATSPLASFSQTTSGATPFFYNSNGNVGSPNATFDSSTSVNFTYLGTPRAGQTFNNVTMSITNSAVNSAPLVAGITAQQPVVFTITFTTTQVQNGVGIGQTLLSMDATGALQGGFLGGVIGTTSIGVQGSDQGPPTPTVTYSSTVVSGLNNNPPGYPPDSARDYSLSLTSLTNPLNLDTDTEDFQDFHASISGVFGFTPNVPEPGTVAMLIGLGCSSSLLAVRRLRRK